MDRRKFLATTGLLAASGAAAPLLGSCRAGDPYLDGASVAVKDAYRCDLLVVGGGPAGVCAAI